MKLATKEKDAISMHQQKTRELATLAGGCFWCLEAIFRELRGVDKVESGYSGGIVPNPSYNEVCTGTTGHAEAIQITFDPQTISLSDLLSYARTGKNRSRGYCRA